MGNTNQNSGQSEQSSSSSLPIDSNQKSKIQIDDNELKNRLTPIQYAVTQLKATERLEINLIYIWITKQFN